MSCLPYIKIDIIKEIMVNETERGLASMHLSAEKENEVFSRCFNMVDYLNEMAVNIIMELLENTSCPVTKQILRNSPEVIAVKAFEKAIIDLNKSFRRPNRIT
jgi:hypothetical protein